MVEAVCRAKADALVRVCVTDFTYIKTQEVWLYLALVTDVFSRRVVGWSAQPRMITEWAFQTLLEAFWPHKPKTRVIIHSDEGSQFISRDWQVFLRQPIWRPA